MDVTLGEEPDEVMVIETVVEVKLVGPVNSEVSDDALTEASNGVAVVVAVVVIVVVVVAVVIVLVVVAVVVCVKNVLLLVGVVAAMKVALEFGTLLRGQIKMLVVVVVVVFVIVAVVVVVVANELTVARPLTAEVHLRALEKHPFVVVVEVQVGMLEVVKHGEMNDVSTRMLSVAD